MAHEPFLFFCEPFFVAALGCFLVRFAPVVALADPRSATGRVGAVAPAVVFLTVLVFVGVAPERCEGDAVVPGGADLCEPGFEFGEGLAADLVDAHAAVMEGAVPLGD